MKRIGFVILFLGTYIALSHAQILGVQEREHMRKQRQSKIELLHIGVGGESAWWNDWQGGLNVYFGLGSPRHLGSVDVGIKYMFSVPMCPISKEKVLLQQLPFFLSAAIHAYRWEDGCLYIGGEAAYHVETLTTHVIPAQNTRIRDNDLRHHHATVSGKIGVKYQNWDINAFYTYDLAPQYNQKYVYESAAYDYNTLHNSLFERMRLGVSLSYAFPLKTK